MDPLWVVQQELLMKDNQLPLLSPPVKLKAGCIKEFLVCSKLGSRHALSYAGCPTTL